MNLASIKNKEENLPEITWSLVESCSLLEKIQHLGHCPLPSYNEIITILDDLFEIIYPGFGRRNNLHLGNIRYFIGDILDRTYDTLSVQIARSFCQSRHASGSPCSQAECEIPLRSEYERIGQERALAFLSKLPALRKILETDVHAAYAGDPACRSYAEVVFCYPGLKAITIYRIAHELHLLGVPLIPRMMTEWAHRCTGIDIHPGATIGSHFFIDHGTGVVIGETCEIGEWVKLYQGVTLGALSFPTDETGQLVRGKKRHPTIEDHVVIYANATVLGGETVIGQNAIIGSSVWITQSVAPNSTVMMEKPNLRIR
ncbi:MAG: serine O-acetyltransferase EpsC [Planctomycetia bacterium]|nr:serine O-acetyltransferase EpsC [Planctomycetia bacterium]